MLETLLAMLYLVHGGPIPSQPVLTDEVAAAQEKRARFFRTMALRRAIYRRQALLDGAWDTAPLSAEQRAGIRAEVQELRDSIATHFPEENAQVGPLACDDKTTKHYDDGRLAWFSFGPGSKPQSIRQLAKAVGYSKVYETVYDALSALVHPRDITQDLEFEDGNAVVLHPHNPEAFPLITRWAALCIKGIVLTFCWAFQQASIEDVRDMVSSPSRLTV